MTFRAECVAQIDQKCTQRASNVTGVSCRQTPVVDVSKVKFDALTSGVVSGQACGEVNLTDNWIDNNMAVFMMADGLSQINVASPVTVLNPVNITYFALSYQGARIFIGGPIVNPSWVSPGASLVYRGGTIISNGYALPSPCSQADPNQPGNCW
jgi:hypothetical protein